MKKLILVYNPVSGDASFKNKLDMMLEKFQQRDCMLMIYRTKRDNAAFPFFVRAAQAEGIIVAGGDGTVHEIVNIVMHEHINLPIAIIGSGTSNDFATYLKIIVNLVTYFYGYILGYFLFYSKVL